MGEMERARSVNNEPMAGREGEAAPTGATRLSLASALEDILLQSPGALDVLALSLIPQLFDAGQEVGHVLGPVSAVGGHGVLRHPVLLFATRWRQTRQLSLVDRDKGKDASGSRSSPGPGNGRRAEPEAQSIRKGCWARVKLDRETRVYSAPALAPTTTGGVFLTQFQQQQHAVASQVHLVPAPCSNPP